MRMKVLERARRKSKIVYKYGPLLTIKPNIKVRCVQSVFRRVIIGLLSRKKKFNTLKKSEIHFGGISEGVE